MILKERSGSKKLEIYFEKKIEAIRESRKLIRDAIKVDNPLTIDQQQTYYSNWLYSAIHIIVSISSFQNISDISAAFNISPKKTREILDYLHSIGLIEMTEKKVLPGKRRIHLSSDSIFSYNHHVNWRLRAIDAIQSRQPHNLHFSGPISLTKDGALELQKLILEFIQKMEKVISEPNEEELFCLNLDYFRLIQVSK